MKDLECRSNKPFNVGQILMDFYKEVIRTQYKNL
jgi:hypothetical protein